LGDLYSCKHGGGHVAGINLAGVGSDAAYGADWFLAGGLGQVGVNFLAENSWIMGIETSGDRWMSN